jgi:DNA-binding MarR family transcriptional regulator
MSKFEANGGRARLPLGFQLLPVIDWWFTAIEKNADVHGLKLSSRSIGMLSVYIVYGERRPIRLAERMGVSRPAMHHAIRQLVERGELTVEPDPDDGRATIVVPTKEFEAGVHRVVAVLDAVEKRIARKLGPKRFSILEELVGTDWGEPPLIELDEV